MSGSAGSNPVPTASSTGSVFLLVVGAALVRWAATRCRKIWRRRGAYVPPTDWLEESPHISAQNPVAPQKHQRLAGEGNITQGATSGLRCRRQDGR